MQSPRKIQNDVANGEKLYMCMFCVVNYKRAMETRADATRRVDMRSFRLIIMVFLPIKCLVTTTAIDFTFTAAKKIK